MRFEEVVRELNKYQDKLPPSGVVLILVGGASLIVKYGLKRPTHDIDVTLKPYVGGIGDLLAKRGFQVVSEGLLNLHPDYEERLEPVITKGKVTILTLSPYDIAIAKISRGLGKDIEDVLASGIVKEIDLSELKRLYFEAINYFVGEPQKFLWAWENFEDAYRKRLGQKNSPKARMSR